MSMLLITYQTMRSILTDLDGTNVVDTRVQTDLVHNNDSGVLGLLLESLHGGRNVRSGDNVLLVPDSALNNSSVVDVRNEGNHEVTVGDGGIEGSSIGNVNGDGLGTSEVGSHLLGGLESSASYYNQ
jgi:hypothetical protein